MGLDLKQVLSSRSRTAALMAIFSSLSMVFGLLNLGFESMLYPFIATIGFPCMYGLTLSHLFMALYHGYGGFDFLTAILLLPQKYFLVKKGFKAYPIHAISLGIWIPVFQVLNGKYPIVGLPVFIVFQIVSELFWGAIGIFLAMKVRERYYV